MAGSAPANHCLQIPIDHRLRSLLRPHSPVSNPFTGQSEHASILEKYGRDLQSSGEKIGRPEIDFAKKLAMPETKGGIVILLQQPAPNQQYEGRDFHTIVQECETLRAVDNVLRAIIGSSLEKTSCFDAFPFQKVPIPPRSQTGYVEYEEAYDVCREMIQAKQPDVVLCCYRSPDITKFDLLYSLGVGKMHAARTRLHDQFRWIPVNAFHPSYAVNYNKGESCFRTLYMVEALQAFHKFNGTWTERIWMDQLRSFCMNRAKDLVIGKHDTNCIDQVLIFPLEKEMTPRIQNFERWERSFGDGINGLMSFFDFMRSDTGVRLNDEECYSRVTYDNISRLTCDCLLVVTFVADAKSKTDDPLSHARDARSVARSVHNFVFNFIVDILQGPFQRIKKDIGLVANTAMERLSQSLRIPKGKSGLQYLLKKNLCTMMRDLNNSFIYESSDAYSSDLPLMKKAFSTFADGLEHALWQHLVATTEPETDDLSLITALSSMSITNGRDNVSILARPTPSATYRPKQISPQKRPVFPLAAARPPTATLQVCFQCKQPGHFKGQCPQTRCYRCEFWATPPRTVLMSMTGEQSGHYGKDCPQFPNTPQKKRLCKQMTQFSPWSL